MDNRPNWTKKYAFLNLFGLVWTGPTFIFLIEESNRKGFQNECQTKNFFSKIDMPDYSNIVFNYRYCTLLMISPQSARYLLRLPITNLFVSQQNKK